MPSASRPTGATTLSQTAKPDAVAWAKPESVPPARLDASLSDPKIQQAVRANLHGTIEVSFEELPLEQAVAVLSRIIKQADTDVSSILQDSDTEPLFRLYTG